ncbi:hypothetical protein Sjap_014250 [Stephania japonica]|uniref:CASP-like protein n=1 Tax=Stephania japonica TaxID=461633 RepID=A0AAP0IZJ4_9MAGN
MASQEEPTSGKPEPEQSGDRDVEAQTSGGYRVSSVLNRWRREDLLKRGSLILRGLALLFSLLCFLITVTNKHGDWQNFDRYEEYRYLLAIAILSSLYSGFQVFRQIREFSTTAKLFSPKTSLLVDFCGDQIVAYLLISASSTAVPLTNNMRKGADNIFTDSSSAAISMGFFAFFAVALSALISGFKLSNQTYI